MLSSNCSPFTKKSRLWSEFSIFPSHPFKKCHYLWKWWHCFLGILFKMLSLLRHYMDKKENDLFFRSSAHYCYASYNQKMLHSIHPQIFLHGGIHRNPSTAKWNLLSIICWEPGKLGRSIDSGRISSLMKLSGETRSWGEKTTFHLFLVADTAIEKCQQTLSQVLQLFH